MGKLIPLVIGAFALGMDAYVIAGLLPVLGADLHTTAFGVGLLVTVFTLAYAVLSPIGSVLSATLPAATVLLGALAVFTVGNALSALAPSLGLLLGARIIAGFGAGVFMPTAAATAAQLVAPHRRGRVLALITAGMSGGAALGVPLGVAIGTGLGWRDTLWLVTALGTLACLGVAIARPRPEARATPPTLRARLGVLAERGVAGIVLVTFACSFSSIGAYTYVSALLRRTIGATEAVGYLWAWGLGGLVGCLGVGLLIDSWRDTRRLQTVILATLALALLSFPLLGRTAVGAVVGLFVWGAAGWACLAPQQHRLLAITPRHGTIAVALNASGLYLGSAVGASIGGLLVEGNGAVVACLALGCLAAVFALVNLVTTPGVFMVSDAPGAVEPAGDKGNPRPLGEVGRGFQDPAVGGSAGGICSG